VTIAVILDEPMIAHQGGAVAAPAFRRIMEASLRHLGVAADHNPAGNGNDALARAAHSQQQQRPELRAAAPVPISDDNEVAHGQTLRPGEALVPNLLGRAARSAIVQARRSLFDVTMQGSGVVTAQTPAAGAVVQRGTILALQLTTPTPELPVPPLASDLAQVTPPLLAPDVNAEATEQRGQDG
jgi:cell division protein FtsI (penicillin-binding protein 3)